MSRTPAAEFARLKLAYPEWVLRRTASGQGSGYTGRRRLPDGSNQTVRGGSLADLEYQLHLIERGEEPD